MATALRRNFTKQQGRECRAQLDCRRAQPRPAAEGAGDAVRDAGEAAKDAAKGVGEAAEDALDGRNDTTQKAQNDAKTAKEQAN